MNTNNYENYYVSEGACEGNEVSEGTIDIEGVFEGNDVREGIVDNEGTSDGQKVSVGASLIDGI